MSEYNTPLPPSWVRVSLGVLLAERAYNGLSIKGSDNPPGVAALKLSAMSENGFNYSFIRYLPIASEETEGLEVRAGDFFVCRGNGSLHLVGRGTVAQNPPFHVIFPDTMIRLRFAKSIQLTGWIPALWAARNIRRQIESKAKTTAGIWKISQPDLSSVTIHLPPLQEQYRIIAELDKHLSRIDTGVAALKRLQANLKRYRASVLKAACEGKLVPTEAELARAEGREYEPADKLLARILEERRARWETEQLAKMKAKGQISKDEGWKNKYQEPARCGTSVLPKLPEGWEWANIEQLLIEAPCNGLSIKGSDAPPGVAALRLNAMNDRGFDYTQIRYLPVHWSEVKDLEIREGDFFVSRGNGSLSLVGRGTLAQAPPQAIIFPDTIIRLRFAHNVVSTGWVSSIWSALHVRRQVEKKAKTTAGIWKVSQGDVGSIVLPIPPQTEQRRIVAEIQRRLSVIEETELTIEVDLKRANRLRQAVLKRAFEGKLVPQDPNDEPASVLLARIRAERAAEPDGNGRGRKPRAVRAKLQPEATPGGQDDG